MPCKLVQRFDYGKKCAKVYHNPDFDEYEVRYYSDGEYMDASDYFTDDRQDAMDTAKAAIMDEREWNEHNNLSGA